MRYLQTRPNDERISLGPDTCTIGQMQAAMQQLADRFKTNETAEFYEWLKEHFKLYRPVSQSLQVTAYCRPRLKGSWSFSPKYPYPLYQLPADWVYLRPADFLVDPKPETRGKTRICRVTPERLVVPGYYTREEIDFGNTLAGRGQVLCWVDSLEDAYFLQVEGSGVIEFEDGTTTHVAYAGANGQPYRGIGAMLVREGALPANQMSIPAIKKHLREHPQEIRRILSSNPSYVFFAPGEKAAVGSLQVPLTPFTSAAVDQRLYPAGGLGWLQVDLPVFDSQGNSSHARAFNSLVFFQDKGGAIQGLDRLDLFCGEGPEAEMLAGYLNAQGRVFVLAPK